MTDTDTERRVCSTPGCTTILRSSNKDGVCASCDAKEIERIQATASAKDEERRRRQLPLLNDTPEPSPTRPPRPAPPSRSPTNGCKVEGCTEPIAAAKGVYAYLCTEHRRARQETVAARHKPGPKPDSEPRKPPVLKPDPDAGEPALRTYADRVRELSSVADELDDLARQSADIQERREPLMQRWADLVYLLRGDAP